MKTWGGRFEREPDQRAADFGRSIEVDSELALDDLVGSMAHARALGRAGILAADEVDRLVAGLEGLLTEAQAGTIVWRPELEDVHMNLESALEERIGPLAQKLHTGRSRNDQVSTDLRLWLRRTLDDLDERLVELERALLGQAQGHATAVMPGHTHVQPAQPVLFAHHLLAYVEMLERDRGRMADARKRANVSPLGSGALAGAGFALEREAVADELGFDGVTRNSIDASGDRDFVVEAIAAFALAMVHLSRLGEEIVWWSNPRFGFVRVADEFSTGSSMLPNKRNPDPAELVRGRAARVIGNLSAALTLLKGLPLGYQRDLQEDKPLLFESARTLGDSLAVMSGLIASLEVDEARMRSAAGEGYTTAVAMADALVDEGVAFRSAHRIVGTLVRRAEAAAKTLDGLSDEDVAAALTDSADERAMELARDPGIGERLRRAATIDGALARSDVIGGTAPDRVRAQLDAALQRLGSMHE
jgi:argininosuccinate lyase